MNLLKAKLKANYYQLVLVILAIFISLFSHSTISINVLQNGNYQMLWLANLFHFSFYHLIYNMATFLIISDLYDIRGKEVWLIFILISPILSLIILFNEQKFINYGGFSGILFSYWVIGIAKELIKKPKNKQDKLIIIISVFLLVIKLLMDYYTFYYRGNWLDFFVRYFQLNWSSKDIKTYYPAHWYGAFCGVIYLVLAFIYKKVIFYSTKITK